MSETPISSSAAEDSAQLSFEKSDLLPTAQPSGSLDPQAKTAVDAAQASLERNLSLSSSIYLATISSTTWANRAPSNPPPARYAHALAYDASAGKVLLFGGFNGSNLFNDTWAYDYATNSWANRNPTNPPPARAAHALAYDTAAGKVILFGGADSSGNFNDTWAYDYSSNAWTYRSLPNPPPARIDHALAYDTVAGKVILFGGYNGSYLNDTWAYDYATNSWTYRTPSNPPFARYGHALAYDASAGKVILFGGASNSTGFLNDTWAYDCATNSWTNRNPSNPAPARADHALAYDASAGKAILFGGTDLSGYLNDTWAYDYATNAWNNRNPTNPPPARNQHALAYDVSADKVILFGGWNNSLLYDTWVLTLGGEVPQTLNYNLTEGWNMISVPLLLDDPHPEAVFPAGWPMFSWDALHSMYLGRIQITLAVGEGYWLKVPSAQTLILEGLPNDQTSISLPLSSGWNLIGTPYYQAVAWGSVTVTRGAETKTLDAARTAGWIGPFYNWTGTSYGSLSSGGVFQPLAGYWMRVLVAGCAIVFPQP